MARYVVTFDTTGPGVLEEQAPGVLSAEGFSTVSYFPRLGIGVVDSEPEHLDRLNARCREQRLPMSFRQELTYYAIAEDPAVPRPDGAQVRRQR